MRIDIKGTIVSNDDKEIYDWYGIENTSPDDVKKQLEKAAGMSVDVYINSGGGDIFAGSEIYSELRGFSGGVKIHITGLAASAASVIACAGKSDISPTAMFMIHNVSCMAWGDYNTMDHTSEILQKCNEAVSAAYSEKTGISKEEALEMMNKETWLTAAEAVEKGLVDEITKANDVKFAAASGRMLPPEVIQKTKDMLKNPENKTDSLIQAKFNFLKMKGGM